MKIAKIGALAALIAFLGILIAQGVQSVTLAWDPSPSPEVSNYNIYYGTNGSGVYTFAHAAGNVTQTTITNLVEKWTYWFVATAQSSDGLESEYSNEVSYTVPGPVSGLSPPRLWVAQ